MRKTRGEPPIATTKSVDVPLLFIHGIWFGLSERVKRDYSVLNQKYLTSKKIALSLSFMLPSLSAK